MRGWASAARCGTSHWHPVVGLDLFNLSCCAGCGERQSAIPGRVTVLPSRSVRDLIVHDGGPGDRFRG